MTDHYTEAERLLQESGDIAAKDIAAKDIAAKDAEIERLREEVAMTERYRDDVIQACAAAEHERDIAACRLGGIGNALGLAAVDTADLPRLARELRDERDHWESRARSADSEMLMLKADRDRWADRAAQNMGEAIDLKARAVVHAASPGPARPGGTSEAHFQTQPQSAGKPESTSSREPGCSNECSEMHTYELPCDLATEDAGRVCGSDKCDGDCCEPTSREPDGAVMDARRADKAPCGNGDCDCVQGKPGKVEPEATPSVKLMEQGMRDAQARADAHDAAMQRAAEVLQHAQPGHPWSWYLRLAADVREAFCRDGDVR